MTVYIHGAYSAPDSFNYIRVNNISDNDILIEYDSNNNMITVLDDIQKLVENKTNQPVQLVGHSLGGVLAVALASRGLKTKSIVTMSSPFGGIGNFWPPKTIGYEMMKLKKFCKKPPTVPYKFFVSTDGHNSWLLAKNDGVVTITSQMAIPKAKYIQVATNHFEILLNDLVIKDIAEFQNGSK